jgi:hypothetical protein
MRCRRSLRTNSSKDWCNAPPKDLVRRFGYCRVGEFVAATRGLGYLLSFAQSTYNAALMFPERRQRSNLLAYWGVLSFRSEAREVLIAVHTVQVSAADRAISLIRDLH